MSFITVVSPVSTFCGKTFSLNNGKIEKSRGLVPARSVARTVACGSLRELQTILNGLQSGEAVVLGYVPETIGVESYGLISTRLLNELGNSINHNETVTSDSIITTDDGIVLARLKKHFKPSGFFCLDRDIDEDAPEDIRKIQQLPAAQYVRLICEELNDEVSAAFFGADYLRVPSSTGRVLMPDGSPISSDVSEHLFFQAANPDDIERFALAFCAATIANGYSYLSETAAANGGVIHRKKFIFDPSVFTLGRLFFESAPRVTNGLKLISEPATYQPWLGNLVNTAAVREPSHSIQTQLEKLNMRFHGTHFESDGLSPSLVVETQEHGAMSVDQYDRSGLGKIRCQSPFRQSSSWAAYLNRHDDGSVYLWDEGTRTKYKIIEIEDESALRAAAAMVDRFRANELANRNMKQFAIECGLDLAETVEEYDELHEQLDSVKEEATLISNMPKVAESVVQEHNSVISIANEEEETLNKIQAPKPKFEALSIAELQQLRLPRAESLNLWGNRAFVAGGFTAVVGAPKVGKSSFLLYMMMCAACGRDWLGYRFTRELKILWLQAELMLPFLIERIDQAMEGFTEIEREKIRQNIAATGQFNAALNSTDQYAYKKIIEQHQPDMVIIDPLRNLANFKSENDNAEMIATLVALRDSAKEVKEDVCLVVAHHTRKIGESGGKGKQDNSLTAADPSVQFDKIAGAGAFRGMYDAGFMIQQDPQQQLTKQIFIDIRNGQPMGTIEARRENEAWLIDGQLTHSAKVFAGVDEDTISNLIIAEVCSKLRKSKAFDAENAAKLSQLRAELIEYLFVEHKQKVSERKFMNVVECSELFTTFKNPQMHNAVCIYIDDSTAI